MTIRWLLPGLLLAAGTLWRVAGASPVPATPLVLSIVGTTDLHGRIASEQGRGGLARLGGYLRNLRAARDADGGAVLLLDAGDTFQGGIASNLSEGAVVIDAYNALGYTALAIGNHDFEFGGRDTGPDGEDTADPRGALKAAAAMARFPFLAANLVESGSERPVDWPNVRPSVHVQAAGLDVGLVGVMTADALTKTIAANVDGLATTPLVPAIVREATALRRDGARVVIVVAHAGGRCERFDRPDDTSTCAADTEIVQTVHRLPRGLVDAVVAGHTHGRMAHRINGIPVIQAGSLGQAFVRVDLQVDRSRGALLDTRLHPPVAICAHAGPTAETCGGSTAAPPAYEGRAVEPDGAVERAMAPALAAVAERRAHPLGTASVATPLTHELYPESPVANLFADAMRTAVSGTDVALGYGAGLGGLRTGLPSGPVTAGRLYDVFPFDNRVARVTLTPEAIEALLTEQIRRRRGRLTGLSGLTARVACGSDGPRVSVRRPDGGRFERHVPLVVAVPVYSNGRPLSLEPPPAAPAAEQPMLRDVVSRWMRAQAHPLRPDAFVDPASPRWEMMSGAPACRSTAEPDATLRSTRSPVRKAHA